MYPEIGSSVMSIGNNDLISCSGLVLRDVIWFNEIASSASFTALRSAQFVAAFLTCSRGAFAFFQTLVLTAYWTPGSIESGNPRTSRTDGFHASALGARKLAALIWSYPGRVLAGAIEY